MNKKRRELKKEIEKLEKDLKNIEKIRDIAIFEQQERFVIGKDEFFRLINNVIVAASKCRRQRPPHIAEVIIVAKASLTDDIYRKKTELKSINERIEIISEKSKLEETEKLVLLKIKSF